MQQQGYLTLKDWKASMRPGRQMVCTHRWYWDRGTPGMAGYKPRPADGRELCTIVENRTTQTIYSGPQGPRLWMPHPRASELKATHTGFELYFPTDPKWGDRSGILMSRYEWVPESAATAA